MKDLLKITEDTETYVNLALTNYAVGYIIYLEWMYRQLTSIFRGQSKKSR